MNTNNNYTAKINQSGLYCGFSIGEHNVAVQERLLVYTDCGVAEFNGAYSRNDQKYVFDCDFASLTLVYENACNGSGFSERKLTVLCKRRLRILKVEKVLKFSVKAEELIDYKTFRYASASAFIRFGAFGLFTGFANPYFKTFSADNNTVIQSFEPSLILEGGEQFEFDCDFTGAYMLCGELLYEHAPLTPLGDKQRGYMTRYHNPSSLTPLDKNEIAAFGEYTHYWLKPSADKFIFEFYMYFSPVRPQPTEADEEDYYRYIDNFKKLGGDLIVFQPLQRQSIPKASYDGYWEVYKPGSVGERIFKYAKAKGLECGIYMGSAQENSPYCNSAMNAYADKSVKPEWKKTDASGTLSNENCIACDGFADWFFNVQKNTIEKYGLGFWNWDPGPGNGHFCYNESHGHIAGKGEYKGFRNASALIGKIKKLRGGIYLQSFHGIKEYGVWGLKYFDQHEAYWEQDPGFFATTYPDFSADRITADGMRLQAQWNMNFRFLPAVINHSLTNRMIQNCNNPETYFRALFDFYGYKYALMSALATGASITSPIVPFDTSCAYVKEYFEFYNKWTSWARENFAVLKNCKLFGSQVGAGIDGYAHVSGERAFIFLFNANPVRGRILFQPCKDLGFNGEGNYCLKQLFPAELNYFDEELGKGVFTRGDGISVEVDGYSARLFEIKAHKDEKLFGINGTYRVLNNALIIENAEMPYGSFAKAVFTDGGISRLTINGVNFKTEKHAGGISANVLFGGNCDRQLTQWQYNGKPFGLLKDGLNCGNLSTCFEIDTNLFIKQYGALEREKLAQIAEEKGNGGNMHLSWSVPDRIYFVIPFTDCDGVERIRLSVNGNRKQLKRVTAWAVTRDKTVCFIADITKEVKFGEINGCEIYADAIPENTFSGAYLAYGEMNTDKVLNCVKKLEVLEVPAAGDTVKKALCEGIKITEAFWRGGSFAAHKEVTLCVKINCAPEKVKRVFCSVPITIDGYSQLSMNTDRSFNYNVETGLWEVKLIIGDRSLLILDDCVSHIRAVDTENFADDFVLPVSWEF